MTEQLWGGRFAQDPDPAMARLTSSIATDIRLLPYDLMATKAHARALVKGGLLDPADESVIEDACDAILADVDGGDLSPAPDDEDVHSFVERVLTERTGKTGRRIHAGRSRNDLVVTSFRLWCRAEAAQLAATTGRLIDTLVEVAADHVETVMPGYTHLQRAQPVTLAFHLAAHGYALERDGSRFRRAQEAADVSGLGAGALATSTLALDRAVTTAELGFSAVFANAMDAVSDRDFAAELVFAAGLCCQHLSRLATDIVLWTTAEFGFARLSDEWSTGSSMMPQKRNPDMAELIRGRAASSGAEISALLGLLHGLPLSYNRDLQEDKEIVFRSVDRAAGCLEGMTGLVPALTFDKEAMRAAAAAGGAWATDAAEALVARGVPFRDAHNAIGRLVARLENDVRPLEDEELSAFHPDLRREDLNADPAASVARRSGPGGPAPDALRAQLEELRVRAAELLSA
jgi:argininosuccinate lyase